MALAITTYHVKIALTEDMLGTVPKDKEVYAKFIATKMNEHVEQAKKKGMDAFTPGDQASVTPETLEKMVAEEIGSIKEIEEKGWTGFRIDPDTQIPFIYNYMLKGFMCESGRTLKEHGKIKALKDKVKRYVFINPRKIFLDLPADYKFAFNERPLRAETAQGPRVTVVRSDVLKAGSLIDFDLEVLKGGGVSKAIITDILEYGRLMGLGQWRSGGWGTFVVKEFEKTGGPGDEDDDDDDDTDEGPDKADKPAATSAAAPAAKPAAKKK